ncbi:MAG: zinc ABC transporter substrate-binding protein [Alphaproteobacteria bacterium]|nr:zinc ABC transporter substrate-binding protein [Alphaproteobacteria bacterium]
MKKCFLALLIVLFTAVSPASAADKPLRIVASFSILGDMVKQVGGDAVEVYVLAGPEADMHTYQPDPNGIRALAAADIIVINGLGLDQWMQRMIEASGTHAKLLVASAGAKPRLLGEGDSAVADPHAWQNLAYGKLYVRNITGALMGALPARAEEIHERAVRYTKELKDMDKYVHEQLDDIPQDKRKIITTHDAFGYFGEAYNITFLSPLGMSTGKEASPAGVAKLIEQIKDEGIKEVFIENMTDPRLMKRIAKESGAEMSGELYSDSLSQPGGPAPTYLGMFRNNVPKLRKAMMENRGN